MTLTTMSNIESTQSTHTPSLPPLYFAQSSDESTIRQSQDNIEKCQESQTSEANNEASLQNLPPELLHRCLTSYSDWGDLAKLACVQSSWKNLVDNAAEFGGREAMRELSMCLLHGDSEPGENDSGDGNGGSEPDENDSGDSKKDQSTDANNSNARKKNRGLQKNEQLAVKYLMRMSGVEVDESQFPPPTNSEDDTTSTTKSALPNDWQQTETNEKENNNADEAALLQLATCHLTGTGTPTSHPNPSLALHYLQSAYHLTNSVQSAHHLASLYEYPHKSNNLIPIDVYAAFEWFKAAAEGGHVPSMSELALCYELGCGVTQSDTEALDWYMKAAEKGCKSSHFSVGEAFEEARGVPMDEEEACLWYYRAAVLGEEDGKMALKRLVHVARRVVRDVDGILNV